MDFVEGLPKSEGFDSILVVVDRLTKFAHFIPLRHPFSAAQVARAFWDNVVKLHGIPSTIVSDRGSVFTSALWRALMAAAGTKLQFSTAYHSQTDGQTERVNQCMEMYLRCAIHDTPRLWRRWLSAAEFWYNSSHHASLTCSPFKALFGREPNLGAMANWDHTDKPVTDLEWEQHTARLKDHLTMAQQRFKRKADRHRTEREFDVDESVLLKLQPYAQYTVANRPCKKLSYKFFGPFTVEKKIGTLSYKLTLPEDSRIHPVFHVSQLKPFTPDYSPVFAELPQPPDLTATEVQPIKILDRRMVKKGNTSMIQVLIKWSSLPQEAATWEDYDVLRLRYPTACIWEGATSQGEGIVITSVPAEHG